MSYKRYAVYYTPSDEGFAHFGAEWLGWDIARGEPVDQPEIPDLPAPLPELTETPRPYGFHGTIKPPFRLAEDKSESDLFEAFDRLCTQMPPATLDGLELAAMGRFLALVVRGDTTQLQGIAAMAVETLDSFRAPPTDAELEKRRAAGLTDRQEALLQRWGYPYVMEDFRFHMTLSSKLPKDQLDAVRAILAQRLHGQIPQPFVFDGLSLVGEAEDGHFHLIQRHTFPA
ncbi:DUF1045 domain-containing protein [Roseovarius indicus]|uniref:Phosphonate metabolism protein n=1 Tax=Roseovarius indicus TaxID=540747 RepID=A0A0T5P1U1_9RHOB|nr:DUF1045 domain-containing protein [Roseovarius indicus]KRS15130.1 phosphonate metabolism protein [Roseovarius indicus]QEW24777.1 putative phosphonate metabolism protein [Roseovarius indicus]SFE51736.1 putative phosphonate metabolism protein [Roseovarius indicus]